MSEFDDMMYDNDLENTEEDSVFKNQSDLYGDKIKAIPKPELEIGIDRMDSFITNIVGEGDSGAVDISKINSFTQISSNRNTVYDLLDTMAEDPMIASALEIYTEDVTETNDRGQIVWCEADDPEIGKLVTYYLDSLNIDKNIYEWAHSFIKYGDLYLKLYRKSDLERAGLFSSKLTKAENDRQYLNEDVENDNLESEEILNEDVVLKIYKKDDPYIHYVEMAPNPAELFELTKFGKTFVYIEAEVPIQQQKETAYMNSYYKYSFKSNDVNIYQPTSFVHACLKDNTSRSPEEVDLSVEATADHDGGTYTYNVKRGQSILYNTFKIWREMTLLENSMLLNRLTKSSIIRLMNVEVGDMPKEEIGPHLAGIKRLIEQKTALNTGKYMEEYTNPGPVENYVYVPTHNGMGAISSEELGGDTSVKGLEDVDYFKNKLMGSLKIPGQYLGFTDDNTGFNGGTALSIVSSRYAKTVKRIQNHLIQMITDLINLLLIDKHLDNYINKFTIRMQEPTTQEEIDRKESKSTSVGIVQDILGLLDGLQKESSKLKALKILLSTVVSDSDITDIIQEEIDLAEAEEEGMVNPESDDMFDDGDVDVDLDLGGGHSGMHTAGGLDDFDLGSDEETGGEDLGGEEAGGDNLPSPDELGAGDFTDNTMEF
mgnify:CR=1 FL=1